VSEVAITRTYHVIYTTTRSGEDPSVTFGATVQVTEGYTDLGDIPRIIAVNTYGGPALAKHIRVTKIELERETVGHRIYSAKAQGPVYTLQQLGEIAADERFPLASRWQQVYAHPSENVHNA
jgi:hypothetical protein